MNGRPSRRPGFPTGNRRAHPPSARRRAPTAREGDDRWVVISCRTEEQWRGAGRRHGRPAVGGRARASPRWRAACAHADDLDAHVEAWTSRARPLRGHGRCSSDAGVPAGAVQDAADRLERDPSSQARGHYTTLGNAEVGAAPARGRPLPHVGHRRRTPGAGCTGARRCLGEDNDTVLRDVLGMSADDIAALARRGGPVVTPALAARGGARPRAHRRVRRVLRPAAGRAGRRRGEGRATRGRAVAPRRTRSSTTSPGPTAAWPSGPTTWASARSWSPTTTRCWTCAAPPTCSCTRCARRRPRPGASTSPPLHGSHPALVVCALTPFGQDGPWADYLADDLVLMALGGSMAACGYGTGRRRRLRHAPAGEPRRPGVAHGRRPTRRIAVLGALAWRIGVGRGPVHRRLGPRVLGQHDRVAPHDVPVLGRRAPPRAASRRSPRPTAARWRRSTPTSSDRTCSRGMLEMLEAEGVAGPLSDPAFADPVHRAAELPRGVAGAQAAGREARRRDPVRAGPGRRACRGG